MCQQEGSTPACLPFCLCLYSNYSGFLAQKILYETLKVFAWLTLFITQLPHQSFSRLLGSYSLPDLSLSCLAFILLSFLEFVIEISKIYSLMLLRFKGAFKLRADQITYAFLWSSQELASKTQQISSHFLLLLQESTYQHVKQSLLFR